MCGSSSSDEPPPMSAAVNVRLIHAQWAACSKRSSAHVRADSISRSLNPLNDDGSDARNSSSVK